NYFKLGDMKTVLSRIDSKLRSRIRVIIWKQWKKNAKRIRNLVILGIPEEEAKGLTYCRKGYRFIAKSKVVHRALSNKRLEQRGIPFALSYYLKVHTVI
ncbi:MAG: group II intron reverse transcriptase/maturase, partial [Streptococcaceae bacterium]|nr:group II intron reverse transcriptase/maturase [Streptococcaceae bacterium]